MTDTARRLAELVAGCDLHDEQQLRSRARSKGLHLRRVRLRDNQWQKQDIGILVAFPANPKTALMTAFVIDTTGGRALAVDAHGQRRPAPPASDLHEDALALVAPHGRRMARKSEALAAGLSGLAVSLLPVCLLAAPALQVACLVLALAAAAYGLTEPLRRRLALRHLALADLEISARLWRWTSTASRSTLTHPSASHRARWLADQVLVRRKQALQTSQRLRGLGLGLPAGIVLACAAPVPLACVAMLLGPALFLRYRLAQPVQRSDVAQYRASDRLDGELRLSARLMPRLRLLGAGDWVLARVGLKLTRWERAEKRRLDMADRLRNLEIALPHTVAGLVLLSGGHVSIGSPTASPIPGLAPDLLAVALLAGLVVKAGLLVATPTGYKTRPRRTAPQLPVQALRTEAGGADCAASPTQEARIETLAMESVSFFYPGADRPLIENLSLDVRRGTILALTGPSGSGKTTVLRLLLGLLEPHAGRIVVNGPADMALPAAPGRTTEAGTAPSHRQGSVQIWDWAAFRPRLGAVFQDEATGMDTIRNVILGMAPVSETDLSWALGLTGLQDDIAALPMGIQTLVAEGIVPRSLDQRLLIARALVRRPDILVLDETTSDLAEDQQNRLLAGLREAEIGAVIATHRASTLALADKVVRLPG